ncbi:plasmid pRiA4b ORF-3 family protein [Actinomycetospora termitidis]|uniref:Plasmid pRiA4b ORF-3 family protein n=1 Tax=Actinomycetospora termitidis TaxID=3053470 RepID=A0ABT7MAB5_9PSEU|nr:plasmid pRiA4b ORF-3 family protein [Actinomycetospora sp. Odt1-22]MDL5157597.1 plasmid pRiA4b ORF-3 family protein [Actinomycetospora sp. Odt1-22]
MRKKARRTTRTTRIHLVGLALNGVEPPVTRSLELAADTDLEDLHLVLQAAMGWSNSHLHEFEVGGVTYGEPEGDEMEDEAGVRLSSLVEVGGTLTYTYDYGDLWGHTLTVLALSEPEPGVTYPRLVSAAGACPPEDCGGPMGYADLLAALRDPDDASHDEVVDWLGADFDPADPQREQLEQALAAQAWTPLGS